MIYLIFKKDYIFDKFKLIKFIFYFLFIKKIKIFFKLIFKFIFKIFINSNLFYKNNLVYKNNYFDKIFH